MKKKLVNLGSVMTRYESKAVNGSKGKLGVCPGDHTNPNDTCCCNDNDCVSGSVCCGAQSGSAYGKCKTSNDCQNCLATGDEAICRAPC